jgi:hypothetical protein
MYRENEERPLYLGFGKFIIRMIVKTLFINQEKNWILPEKDFSRENWNAKS